MNFLKSSNPLILTSFALALAACATHPITTISPGVYQIKHSTGLHGAVKGIRNGLTQIAEEKCAEEHGPFTKLREEITPENTLTYVLTFACQPQLQSSGYTGTQANDIPASTPMPSPNVSMQSLYPSGTEPLPMPTGNISPTQ